MPVATTRTADIHYESRGPDSGRPVVFVHGYAMGGSLWEPLAAHLAEQGFRCLLPTWPLGAHPEPLHPGAPSDLPTVARTVADVLETLDLHDVVLVGNDTGGLVSQLVAVHHPERLGALVLTSCDAFENFPPPVLRPFVLASRSRATFRAAVWPLRLAAVRRRAYGGLAHRDIDDLAAAWVRPALRDPRIVEDLRRLTASLDRATSIEVGHRLGEITLPTLIAWSADDVFFPIDDAHRLAQAVPHARLEVIEGARTFSMLDRPDHLAGLVAGVAA
jgi:pimeloyl-ACP methyl ester carboxylesterase